MKTLVTGGAGFIGTHLVRALTERGDQVVVLDSLESQVHGQAPPEIPSGVEFLVGNVGDAELADQALEGVDSVVHLAAAVGVGQSMYEIARYTELNTMATARFLEALVATRPAAASPRRRLVDVDLRRGRVRLPDTRAHGAGPAPRGAAARPRVGDALPDAAAREMEPDPHARDQAAAPDLDLRDQQA